MAFWGNPVDDMKAASIAAFVLKDRLPSLPKNRLVSRQLQLVAHIRPPARRYADTLLVRKGELTETTRNQVEF